MLGVTIIDKILSSMQEVMKNSSRCDRCHSHECGIDYHNNLTKHALHIVQQKTTAYLALHTVRSMYDQPLRTCAPTKWRPHESFNRNCSLCLQSDLSWTLNATLQRLLNANRRGRRRNGRSPLLLCVVIPLLLLLILCNYVQFRPPATALSCLSTVTASSPSISKTYTEISEPV